MAKKPILMDDELDADLPGAVSSPPVPPVPPATPVPPVPLRRGPVDGATRPVDSPVPPAPPVSRPAATRPQDMPEPPIPPAPLAAPETSGRDASGHARPKTRIHGYGGRSRDEADNAKMKAAEVVAPVVGWLVVTAGPGRGASVALVAGMNAIGRGDDNHVQIDFGDDSISRDPHAFVTYDDEARAFHVSHGGKINLVRLNDTPVLSTEPLTHCDTLRIGATSLRFVALCGPGFDWSDT